MLLLMTDGGSHSWCCASCLPGIPPATTMIPPPQWYSMVSSQPWGGGGLTQATHETFDSVLTAVVSRQHAVQACFVLQSSKAKYITIVTIEHKCTE